MDDSRVVGWQWKLPDGMWAPCQLGEGCAEYYDKETRALVPLSLLAEAERLAEDRLATISKLSDMGAISAQQIYALQSRLDAVLRLADKWEEFDRRKGSPAVHSAAAQLRAALGSELGNEEVR